MPKRSNLIITKVGTNSVHPNWLKDKTRNFDLLVLPYRADAMPDEAAEPEDGVRYVYLPMLKIAGLAQLFADMPELLDDYERIALIDDDIDTDGATLSACFDEGEKLDLLIWQPGLTWNSYVSFGGLMQQPFLHLRYVNFIEMMCPFFNSAYLKRAVPLLSLGYEVGPDLIWCSLTDQPTGRFAVMDSFSVTHTRPVGQMKDVNGFANKTHKDDTSACLNDFGMKWPYLVSDHAITKDGKSLRGQFALGLLALTLLPAPLFVTGVHRLRRLNFVLAHLRNQFLRKPAYGQTDEIVARMAELVPADHKNGERRISAS